MKMHLWWGVEINLSLGKHLLFLSMMCLPQVCPSLPFVAISLVISVHESLGKGSRSAAHSSERGPGHIPLAKLTRTSHRNVRPKSVCVEIQHLSGMSFCMLLSRISGGQQGPMVGLGLQQTQLFLSVQYIFPSFITVSSSFLGNCLFPTSTFVFWMSLNSSPTTGTSTGFGSASKSIKFPLPNK